MTNTENELHKELLEYGCEELYSNRGVLQLVFREHLIAKKCVKCSEIKRVEEFHKRKNGLGGRRADCRTCKNADTQDWRVENSEEVAEYDVLVKGRRAETSRRWKMENTERNREMKRTWTMKNKQKRQLSEQKRQAVKRALPSNCEFAEVESICAIFGGKCALSMAVEDIHLDHVVPFFVGHGGTIASNLIPLDSKLNTSKNNRHLFEWYEANHERFELNRRKFDALIAYLAEVNEMTTQEYRKYVDWCFDNPRIIDAATGDLVFRDGPINERNTSERMAIT